jgi:transglutaminase-like putative cysteine protease
MAEDQHGDTHAWTEVYIPGGGCAVSIRPTISSPAKSMFPSLWPASTKKLVPFAGHGKVPQTHSAMWKYRCRSFRFELKPVLGTVPLSACPSKGV